MKITLSEINNLNNEQFEIYSKEEDKPLKLVGFASTVAAGQLASVAKIDFTMKNLAVKVGDIIMVHRSNKKSRRNSLDLLRNLYKKK